MNIHKSQRFWGENHKIPGFRLSSVRFSQHFLKPEFVGPWSPHPHSFERYHRDRMSKAPRVSSCEAKAQLECLKSWRLCGQIACSWWLWEDFSMPNYGLWRAKLLNYEACGPHLPSNMVEQHHFCRWCAYGNCWFSPVRLAFWVPRWSQGWDFGHPGSRSAAGFGATWTASCVVGFASGDRNDWRDGPLAGGRLECGLASTQWCEIQHDSTISRRKIKDMWWWICGIPMINELDQFSRRFWKLLTSGTLDRPSNAFKSSRIGRKRWSWLKTGLESYDQWHDHNTSTQVILEPYVPVVLMPDEISKGSQWLTFHRDL